MDKKHLAFMYLLFRVVDAYANRLAQYADGNHDQYGRLKLFMDSHDNTDINKDVCMALPVLTIIEGSHKHSLAEFWGAFTRTQKTFVPDELVSYFTINHASLNRVFKFDLNTIFVTEEFHHFCSLYGKISILELITFLEIDVSTIDSSVPLVGYMIDESIKQLSLKKNFIEIVQRPAQYAKSFPHVRAAFKGAGQFFDANGFLLAEHAQKPKAVFNYIHNRITDNGGILVPT